MLENELTLEELSERTGVEARTLRSWISEGLLSPPFKPGRGARYPASNADRALAVRALKDIHALSLADIGRRFMMASEEQIREWAQEVATTRSSRGSARSYLRELQERKTSGSQDLFEPYSTPKDMSSESSINPQHMASVRSSEEPPNQFRKLPPEPRERRQAELASIERLILQLEEVLEVPAPRRARGSIWTRISVTPDLELSIRGDLEPRERALFEQLADQFCAILSGRIRND